MQCFLFHVIIYPPTRKNMAPYFKTIFWLIVLLCKSNLNISFSFFGRQNWNWVFLNHKFNGFLVEFVFVFLWKIHLFLHLFSLSLPQSLNFIISKSSSWISWIHFFFCWYIWFVELVLVSYNWQQQQRMIMTFFCSFFGLVVIGWYLKWIRYGYWREWKVEKKEDALLLLCSFHKISWNELFWNPYVTSKWMNEWMN